MPIDDLRLAVHPGSGVVGRIDGVVLLISGRDSAGSGAQRIIDICRDRATATVALHALCEAREPGLPQFCVLVEEADRIAVFLHGAIEVVAAMQGRRIDLALTEADGWMEDSLQSPLVRLTVSDKPLKTAAGSFFDLIQGVVPGGGLEMMSRTATVEGTPAASGKSTVSRPAPASAGSTTAPPPPPVAAVPAAPPETPAADSLAPVPAAPQAIGDTAIMPPIESVSESAAGLDLVGAGTDQLTMSSVPTKAGGFTCGNGHANEPGATICWVCGLTLRAAPAAGERVALGRFVSKDFTVVIDRNLLIGRKPDEAPEVASGQLAPIEVPADAAAVSRVHAEVRVDEWNAFIVDRGSANGTFIRPPATTEWIKLEPGHAVKIVPGVAISIGPYEFTFEPA
jgi:hypothetical protein